MSGTTSLCLQQQWHNATHEPLVGGLLYSYQAGTLTPQDAYRSAALTVGDEFPNPVTLDASGRVPQMFYDDSVLSVVRLILTDSSGISQFDYDNVPLLGSSGGGGGGGVDTTDVNRLYSTGDMKLRYGTGVLTGYVRGNGKTIGRTGSPATEFADDTTQALFQYLWNLSLADLSLQVFPTRGGTASDDWGDITKHIATPDFRGVAIGGLDGMGNTRANRMAAAAASGTSLTNWDLLGWAGGGLETHTLTVAQMPLHKHTFTGTARSNHTHAGNANTLHNAATGTAAGSLNPGSTINFGGTIPVAADGGFTPAGSLSDTGSSEAHPILQPTRLVTVYIRL